MKNVVVLAYDGAQALDITGPMEVFAQANRFSESKAYNVTCLSATDSLVTLSNGLTLSAISYADWPDAPIDTFVLTGGTEDALLALQKESKFLEWLSQRLAKSRRIVSVCTGAFILAKLGVLDGRRASTHWASCDLLQQFAPAAEVDHDAIYSQDGNVYTSAGVTCGIDLTLSLVEQDLGRAVCAQIAKHMVLYLRRSGGQSQFSAPLKAQSQYSNRMEQIIEYITNHPDKDLRIDTLATHFAMSPRHFSRLFTEELKQTPAEFVSTSRLNLVRVYLEESTLTLKQIASRCGYRSCDSMGRAFRKQFGVAPYGYRQRFT